MKEIKCEQHKMKKINDKNHLIYSKVDNDKRTVLLNMVKEEGKSLKEASNLLKINYSTAKTILRVYRIEKRILKKSSNGNKKNNKGCTCVSADSKHKVHSTFDSPEKDSEIKSSDNFKENINFNVKEDINFNMNSNSNVKVIHNKQPDFQKFENFSLNRVEKKISHGSVQSNITMVQSQQNAQENKFINPKIIQSKSPPLLNQSSFSTHNFFNDFLQKLQFNMLSLQNCQKEIDHNAAMMNNVYYLFDRMRMNQMFS